MTRAMKGLWDGMGRTTEGFPPMSFLQVSWNEANTLLFGCWSPKEREREEVGGWLDGRGLLEAYRKQYRGWRATVQETLAFRKS